MGFQKQSRGYLISPTLMAVSQTSNWLKKLTSCLNRSSLLHYPVKDTARRSLALPGTAFLPTFVQLFSKSSSLKQQCFKGSFYKRLGWRNVGPSFKTVEFWWGSVVRRYPPLLRRKLHEISSTCVNYVNSIACSLQYGVINCNLVLLTEVTRGDI